MTLSAIASLLIDYFLPEMHQKYLFLNYKQTSHYRSYKSVPTVLLKASFSSSPLSGETESPSNSYQRFMSVISMETEVSLMSQDPVVMTTPFPLAQTQMTRCHLALAETG